MKRVIVASLRWHNYEFYICNSEGPRSRGHEPDTFDVKKTMLLDDNAAYTYAVGIIYQMNVKDVPLEYPDPQAEIENQDPGAGWPFVYGIKKDGSWLYQDAFFEEWEDRRTGNFEY